MIIVCHRRNRGSDLRDTPPHLGVEVDIRSHGEQLILHHDPFVPGEPLEEWLVDYAHRFLILNVKEEGLEKRVLEMINEHGIENFFFLDQSFPFLIKTARQGEQRCATRVSDYESVETALSLKGMIDWVWVDCFGRFPLNGDTADTLKRAGFKLCLVSPELQGREEPSEIQDYQNILSQKDIRADAVCTKKPELWSQGKKSVS